MPTEFIFAYGSNMNRSDLRSWLEAAGHDSSLVLDAVPAVLEGYDYMWNYYSQGRAGGTARAYRRPRGGVLPAWAPQALAPPRAVLVTPLPSPKDHGASIGCTKAWLRGRQRKGRRPATNGGDIPVGNRLVGNRW